MLKLKFEHLETNKHKWRFIIGSAVFYCWFFLMFEPFEVSASGDMTFFEGLSMLGLLFLTVVVGLAIPQFILKQFFKRDSENAWSFVLYYVLEVMVLSSVSLLFFDMLLYGGTFTLGKLMEAFSGVLLVMTFPYSYGILYVLLVQQKNEITELNTQLGDSIAKLKAAPSVMEQVAIPKTPQSSSKEIAADAILYLKSEDNYVKVYYVDEETLKNTLVRNTLASFLEKIETAHIIRCHRSFAVNLMKVQNVNRTSNGLMLELDDDHSIPVSRSFFKEVTDRLSVH